MSDERFNLNPASGNGKTGRIPVATSSPDSCPPSCGQRDSCYAKAGPLLWHWTNSQYMQLTREQLLAQLAVLPRQRIYKQIVRPAVVRLWQAGDFPSDHKRGRHTIDRAYALSLADALAGCDTLAFSHYPLSDYNRGTLRQLAEHGLHVVVSCDAIEDVVNSGDFIAAAVTKGLSRVGYLNGYKFVQCPFEYNKLNTCENCGNGRPLCSRPERDYVIGFNLHGALRKRTNKYLSGFGVKP